MEEKVSKISPEASLAVSEYARSVLERHYPARGLYRGSDVGANVSQACRAIRGSKTDRKTLQEIAYQWPAGRCLQLRRAKRLAELLSTMDPKADLILGRIVESRPALTALNKMRRDWSWADNATPEEMAAFERDPAVGWSDTAADPVERWLAGYSARIPALRAHPGVWRRIEAFRAWGERRHDKWIIRACITRILGPLTGNSRSRGLLRSWSDLTETQKADFIRYGVEREKMMLGSVSIRERARAVNPSSAAQAAEPRPRRIRRPPNRGR